MSSSSTAIKVLVTGPFNAGKSTFIRSLTPRSLSVEAKLSDPNSPKPTTTVALDYGSVEVDGLSVRLFGTPGQERFSFMVSYLSLGMDGYVYIVDSSDAASLARAAAAYRSFRDRNRDTPHVVAANKQDRPLALKPEAVRSIMLIPKGVPVLGLVAMDRESCVLLLKALLESLRSSNFI